MPNNTNETFPPREKETTSITLEAAEQQPVPNQEILHQAILAEEDLTRREEKVALLLTEIKNPSTKKTLSDKLEALKNKWGTAIALTAFLGMAPPSFAGETNGETLVEETPVATTAEPSATEMRLAQLVPVEDLPAVSFTSNDSNNALIASSLATAGNLFTSTLKSSLLENTKTPDASLLSKVASFSGNNTLGNLGKLIEGTEYVKNNYDLLIARGEKEGVENPPKEEVPVTVDSLLLSAQSLPGFASPALSKLKSLASTVGQLKEMQEGGKKDKEFSFKEVFDIIAPLIPQARVAMFISGVWGAIQDLRKANAGPKKTYLAHSEEKPLDTSAY